MGVLWSKEAPGVLHPGSLRISQSFTTPALADAVRVLLQFPAFWHLQFYSQEYSSRGTGENIVRLSGSLPGPRSLAFKAYDPEGSGSVRGPPGFALRIKTKRCQIYWVAEYVDQL